MDRPALLAYQFFWNAVDWVFPPACIGCGKIGKNLCPDCEAKIPYLVHDLCPKCGYPKKHQKTCECCGKLTPQFTALRSVAEYSGAIQNAIVRLKFHNDLGIGYVFAAKLADLIKKNNWQVDLITPVPSSRERLKSRGYNQAGVLARSVALQLGIKYDDKIIIKKRDTSTQVERNAQARRQNMTDVFQASGKSLHSKSVLIVDDVITTGATINDCARAIQFAGAKEVYGISLGRSVIEHI
jgi:competence protein ComFC